MPTYYEYGDWIDWHPDPLEMVCSRDFTGLDTYIDPVEINGVTVDSPVVFHSGSWGVVHYSRAFDGIWPQDDNGLDYAWRGPDAAGFAQIGFSEDVLWPDRGTDVQSIVGTVSHLRGASYELRADEISTAPGNGVHAYSLVSGWVLRPDDLYDAWTGPFFSTISESADPVVVAEYQAAIDATSPGDEWFPVLEKNFPLFVGYQIAGDEIVAGNPVYGGTDPTGTIYVGTDPIYFGMVPDPEEPSGASWVGPGPFYTRFYFDYAGGAGEWQEVPPEWVPTQDPSTGELLPADVPVVVLSTYIDGYQAMISGDHIVPDNLLDVPPGDDLIVAAGREKLTFAVKALWKPPRFRWGREVTTTTVPPRRIFGRSDGATHGARRVLGGGNTVQAGNRAIGGIL